MNTTLHYALRLLAAPLALALAAAPALAGPLDPPPGPVAPTHKTLTQVEPRIPVSGATTPGGAGEVYRITQPGSYYLTENLVGVSGRQGIRITASNVTLDLGGFTLFGGEDSGRGIDLQGELENITIVNGVISGWGNHGIDAFQDVNCTFRDLKLTGNGRDGLNAGDRAIVIDCIAEGNGEQGFDVGRDAVLRSCIASLNAQHGIRTGDGASITGCTARANGGASNAGILTGSNAAISACASNENAGDGIRTGATASVANCSAQGNNGTGIVVTVGSNVTACSAIGNGRHGIDANERASVAGCVAAVNNATFNSAGIRVFFGCTVTGCTVFQNGQGILADGGDNRIDSNSITSNTRGISITGGGCFIVRNSLSGNTTNIHQGAGPSAIGELLNVSGSEITTSNAWANFVY